MIVPCQTSPLKGICSRLDYQQAQIDSLLAGGAIDLSNLAPVDHDHDHDHSGLYSPLDHDHDGDPVAHQHEIYANLKQYYVLDFTTADIQVVSTADVELSAYTFLLSADAGDIIEVDYSVPLYITGSTSRNCTLTAECGGSQKNIGQYYEVNGSSVVRWANRSISWGNVSGSGIYVRCLLTASSGCTVTTNDSAIRLGSLAVKVWRMTPYY